MLHRVNTGFAITVVMCVVLSLVSFLTLRSVISAKDNVTYEHAQDLIEVVKLRTAFQLRVSKAQTFLLTGNPVSLNELSSARADFLSILDGLRSRTITLREKALLDRIEVHEDIHHAAFVRVALLKQNKAPQSKIINLFGKEILPTRDSIDRAINTYLKHKEWLLEQSKNHSNAAAIRAQRLVFFSGVIALILNVFLSILVARTLNQLRKTDEDLRESNKRSTKILESISDAFFAIDRNWNFTYLNSAAERLLREKKETLLGKNIWQSFAERMDSRFYNAAQKALREQTKVDLELYYAPYDTWFEMHIYPSKEGLSVYYRDITEQKRNEENVKLLAYTSSILNMSLDYKENLKKLAELCVERFGGYCLIHSIDLSGKLTLDALFHKEPEKLQFAKMVYGKFPHRLNAPYGPGSVIRTGRTEYVSQIPDMILESSSESPEHLDLLRKFHYQSYICVPLSARGRIFGTITFISTEHHYTVADVRLAEELAHRASLAIDNARLYQEAQEAIRVRDEFLSIASHELKTPLTSLKLQAQLINRSIDKQEATTYPLAQKKVSELMELSDRQIDRLTNIIDDLLDVSRISAGKLVLTIENVDLTQLIDEIVLRFKEQLHALNYALELDLEPNIHGEWDRLRIEQIIVNLLTNAMKYGNGKPIRISSKRLDFYNVQICVEDQGIGIDQDLLDKIFERFERAAATRNIGGLGLGLYIVRQIVTEHGGKISVESKKGKGSKFVVDLPLKRSHHSQRIA